ncbi:two-component hybrid sensor and regulator [Indibacter alkaliphilus LW1]|uniref:histidine kinase n=1 Tax=Indibacter alkaliphilus (strain CCUG 57479 / KCTC 22604 / LW1) TaxID=1189612 RepID=S2DIW6_INDAL|nr:ATP-binding protein [Indibacter alkaliphilus]EOZ97150.1 two-component hybrid sensor and regulator [Indibacter alkaliphilus LW1]
MLSKFDSEDYAFDTESGELIKMSRRLIYVFGEEIKNVLQNIDSFETALFDYKKHPITKKKHSIEQGKEYKSDCLIKIGNDFLEIRDVFWRDFSNGQIKGNLFLKDVRENDTLTWEAILMNLDKFPNPFMIFDSQLQEVLLANRKIIDLIPIELLDIEICPPISKFFKDHDCYLKILDWLKGSETFLTESVHLKLGENQSKWFKIEMHKVSLDGLSCVSVNLIDINPIVEIEKKLTRSNKLLNELVKIQQKFLEAEKFDEPFSELLQIILGQSDASMGFIGRVNISDKVRLKLDAVSDFSNHSMKSKKLFNSFKNKGFLFEHPDNFIEDSILSKEVLIINNFPSGRKIDNEIMGHPKLKNFMAIPILNENEVVGLIGLANKVNDFGQDDVDTLEPLLSFYKTLINVVRIREESSEFKRLKTEKEFLLSSTLENTHDLIFILDEDYNVEFFSNAFSVILGEMASSKIYDMVQRILRRKSIAGKKIIKVREEIKNPSSSIWLDLSLDIIRNDNGEPKKLLGIAKDTTDMVNYQKKLEEALEKEKNINSFKSQFLSIVSHEFKTPLTIMKSSLDILNIYAKSIDQPTEVKPKIFKKILKIENEVNMLNRLVNEVLRLELMESGNFSIKKKKIKTGAFIEKVVGKFNLADKVKLSNNIPLNHEVNWDPVLMESVIENLIENAVKYGGDKPFDFRSYQDGGQVILEVEDYGIGIPPNEVENIFNPFYRAKNSENFKGTGFGLVAVEKFIFQHDGHIKVSSKLGKGTKFIIVI